MADKLWGALLVILLKCFHTNANILECPELCKCWSKPCPLKYHSLCKEDYDNWTNVHCDALNHSTLLHFPLMLRTLNISKEIEKESLISTLLQGFPWLRVLAFKAANIWKFKDKRLSSQLAYLDLSGGRLKHLPNYFVESSSLERLILSGNSLGTDEWHLLKLNLTNLQALDLSYNKLKTFHLKGYLPNLRSLYLQGNFLEYVPKFSDMPSLEVLDLSENEIKLTKPVDWRNSQGKCEYLLPSNLKTLILRENAIETLPSVECNLFTGLLSLKYLDLGDNGIDTISPKDFPHNIASTLRKIDLDGNNLHHISPNIFSHFKKLQFISLSGNHLRTISVEWMSMKHLVFPQTFMSNYTSGLEIDVSSNPISCDCDLRNLRQVLLNDSTVSFKDGIICKYPRMWFGHRLSQLADDELKCFNVTLRSAFNVSCPEYKKCELSCEFDGLPHPQVHWISPEGKVISIEALANDSNLQSMYALSEDGSSLTINDLRLKLTGMYKCFGVNSLGSASSVVQVGVLPDPIGSVIAIVVSAVSFSVAISVNCANMCKCYCENLREDGQYKKEEEEKMASPLHSKQKGLHESVASLNANKYYRKYDYTCQHIFLDAVIKGAHTVKQTLHDAKNSEFSNNVWGYASHLKDRFHIELPSSVQFPRVSMPSLSLPTISMPNISMPAMPNLQSINTNIERLGTSVISRSHTLATSVGSVFTLRWLRYGSSDNDSDSASDSLENDDENHSDESTRKRGSNSFPVTCVVTSESTRNGLSDNEQASSSRQRFASGKSVRFAPETASCPSTEKQSAVTNPSPADDLITEDECSSESKLYQFETSV